MMLQVPTIIYFRHSRLFELKLILIFPFAASAVITKTSLSGGACVDSCVSNSSVSAGVSTSPHKGTPPVISSLTVKEDYDSSATVSSPFLALCRVDARHFCGRLIITCSVRGTEMTPKFLVT